MPCNTILMSRGPNLYIHSCHYHYQFLFVMNFQNILIIINNRLQHYKIYTKNVFGHARMHYKKGIFGYYGGHGSNRKGGDGHVTPEPKNAVIIFNSAVFSLKSQVTLHHQRFRHTKPSFSSKQILYHHTYLLWFIYPDDYEWLLWLLLSYDLRIKPVVHTVSLRGCFTCRVNMAITMRIFTGWDLVLMPGCGCQV